MIDIDRWNEKAITQKTIQYLEENGDRIVYHDQDALNAVLYEDWLALEPRWNMQTSLVFNRHEAPNEAYQKLYTAGNQEPAIIHFTGHDKPWNTLENHPYSALYLNKLKKVGARNGK